MWILIIRCETIGMRCYYFFKVSLLCVGLLGLAACQNVSHQERNYPVSAASTLPPGSRIPEKLMPGILIQNVKARVILDAVVRERLKKRMVVKKRETYSLTMTIQVPNTRSSTEAKMVYTLYAYQNGLWLTARVYQVTEPGNKAETVFDVTHKAGKELQLELEKIAEKWTKK